MPLELLTWYLLALIDANIDIDIDADADADADANLGHGCRSLCQCLAIFFHLFVHKTLVTSCHYDFEKPLLFFRFLLALLFAAH